MIRTLLRWLMLFLISLVTTAAIGAAEVPTPWLAPLLPDRVQAGAVLRLQGEFLGETTDEVAVRFVPDLIVAANAWTETTVEVAVPHAAVSGPIQVVVTRELPDRTRYSRESNERFLLLVRREIDLSPITDRFWYPDTGTLSGSDTGFLLLQVGGQRWDRAGQYHRELWAIDPGTGGLSLLVSSPESISGITLDPLGGELVAMVSRPGSLAITRIRTGQVLLETPTVKAGGPWSIARFSYDAAGNLIVAGHRQGAYPGPWTLGLWRFAPDEPIVLDPANAASLLPEGIVAGWGWAGMVIADDGTIYGFDGDNWPDPVKLYRVPGRGGASYERFMMAPSPFYYPGYGYLTLTTDCGGNGYVIAPCLYTADCSTPFALLRFEDLEPLAVLDTMPYPSGLATDELANFYLTYCKIAGGRCVPTLGRVLPEQLPPGFYGYALPTAKDLGSTSTITAATVQPPDCSALERPPAFCADGAPLRQLGPPEPGQLAIGLPATTLTADPVPCLPGGDEPSGKLKIRLVLDPDLPATGTNVVWLEQDDPSQTAVAADVLLGQSPILTAFWVESGSAPVEETVTWSLVAGSEQVSTGVEPRSLYPDQPEVPFGLTNNTRTATNLRFQSVHLGRFSLKIETTVADHETELELVELSIITPSRLGSSNNQHDAVILSTAHSYGMPPQLVKGHVKAESGFDNGYRYEPRTVDYELIADFSAADWNNPRYEYYLYRLPRRDGSAVNDADLQLPYDRYQRIINYNEYQFPPAWPYTCEPLRSPDGDLDLLTIYYANDGWPRCSVPWMLYNDENHNGICDDNPTQERIGPCDDRQRWGMTRTGYITSVKIADELWFFCKDGPTVALCTTTHPFARWVNLNASEYRAQTVLAASYGLMHVLYTTAVEDMDWKQGVNRGHERHPSELLNPAVGLGLGVGYATSKVYQHSFAHSFTMAFTSYHAYLTAIMRGIGFYRMGNWYEAGYANQILRFSTDFKPETGEVTR